MERTTIQNYAYNICLKADWNFILHILIWMHACSAAQSCLGLFVNPWTVTTRLLCPWDFPGKNIGVGCHSLLQGIFQTQGSNLVSCIAGRFFTVSATREAPKCLNIRWKKKKNYLKYWNSLGVQWLGLSVLLPWAWVSSLTRELRSLQPHI